MHLGNWNTGYSSRAAPDRGSRILPHASHSTQSPVSGLTSHHWLPVGSKYLCVALLKYMPSSSAQCMPASSYHVHVYPSGRPSPSASPAGGGVALSPEARAAIAAQPSYGTPGSRPPPPPPGGPPPPPVWTGGGPAAHGAPAAAPPAAVAIAAQPSYGPGSHPRPPPPSARPPASGAAAGLPPAWVPSHTKMVTELGIDPDVAAAALHATNGDLRQAVARVFS